MSLAVEKLDGSMAKLTITVPAEEFTKAITSAYNKQKTAYEMLSGDWSSDVCSSDLIMKNSNNTTSVPEAKEAMNKFKMEVANELGVNLKQGYNGDLTSRESGSIGGEMVRQMIKKQEQQMSGK